MPKNDLYETIRTFNNEIFNEMIQNLKFLKEILVPITDPKSKINEMVLFCEPKKIDVNHVKQEDLNIFHYTIIGSGLEYVLNHLKFIGKPPYKYHALNHLKMSHKAGDKDVESMVENYPELLFNLLEILNEAFVNREPERQTDNPEYQSIMHLQTIIFNNLFKIVINAFRLLKVAECNYVLHLKIIFNILFTYLKKNRRDINKFRPLLPEIIEHIMHMRKEMGKKKELNDIMLNLPLGIKHLIEYMPFIFDFILESLQNRDERGAIEMLTHWMRVLSNLNDILDPIVGPALRECASDLFETFHSLHMKKDLQPRNAARPRPDQPASKQDQVYNAMYWLLSKLNPKIRIYNDDKTFQLKEDSLNGMKIMFVERDYDPESGVPPNTFTSFSIPQMDQPYKIQESLEHIMEFLTPCLLFCVNKNSMDSELVKRCIKNVLDSDTNADIFNSRNMDREYKDSHLYEEDPKIPRTKQLRSFDIIIRMLFAACLVNGKNHEKMQQQIRETIKSFTCHFVLIYICKNGRLVNKVDDEFSEEEIAFLEAPEVEVGSNSFLKTTLTEINPLLFLDIVCELLYESYKPNNSESKSYSTGSKIVLNEIFRLLKTFYPDEKDYITALKRLEFVDILFKKI